MGLRDNEQQGGVTMIRKEKFNVTAIDVYRGAILGLMGVFYVFLVFLMFV
jgi:hypothetical protein